MSCFAVTSVPDSNSSTADANVLWRNLLPEPSNDFFAEYGTVQWSSSGWTIYGNARVSSKASLNLVGEFLKFDREFSIAHGGVNNNLYATFPQKGNKGIGSFCVSGGSCSTYCAEMDFTVNDGHCFQATTWHTARDESDHDGTAHTGSIGTSTQTSIVDSRRNTRFSSSQTGCSTATAPVASDSRSSWHFFASPATFPSSHRYEMGLVGGEAMLSVALLDLTSGASRPSLSIRCTGEKGAQRTQRVTPTELFLTRVTCDEHAGPICQVAGCLGTLRHAQDQHAQQSVPCHVFG